MKEKLVISLTKNELKTLKIAARARKISQKKWIKEALIIHMMDQLGSHRESGR
jgi:hypothetical protein